MRLVDAVEGLLVVAADGSVDLALRIAATGYLADPIYAPWREKIRAAVSDARPLDQAWAEALSIAASRNGSHSPPRAYRPDPAWLDPLTRLAEVGREGDPAAIESIVIALAELPRDDAIEGFELVIRDESLRRVGGRAVVDRLATSEFERERRWVAQLLLSIGDPELMGRWEELLTRER